MNLTHRVTGVNDSHPTAGATGRGNAVHYRAMPLPGPLSATGAVSPTPVPTGVPERINMFTRLRLRTPLFAVISLVVLLGPGASHPAASGDAASAVSQERLMDGVRWLADDAREGRMTGSPAEEASAQWIADRFAEAGLTPLGNDGTFLQHFQATVGIELGEDNAIAIHDGERVTDLEFESEWNLFGFSSSGDETLPVVFAGYGITAPEFDYDDYEGLDVEGKAVLVLRHEPRTYDPDSPFDGDQHSHHAFFRNKARNALEHGARAMILFTGPGSKEYGRDPIIRPAAAEQLSGGELLAVHVSKEVGEALLSTADVELDDWVDGVDETLKPDSFPLPDRISAHLDVAIEKKRTLARNVVGMIPGTDPDAGSVILGAHYDHLGRGNSSSLDPDAIGKIHNGADDNASGTSAVVELARVFAQGEPPRRNIVFALFSGEELGLLGSAHMAGHPPVALETVQAMLNLDMVGRPNDKSVQIGGVGTSPVFEGLVEETMKESWLEANTSSSGIGPSDHTSFFAKGVPVLFFFSGLHSDYHRPSDDTDEIDAEGYTEIVRVVEVLARNLADREDRIALNQGNEAYNPHAGEGVTGRGYGPYLGTIPDFGDHEGGVKLTGVREGSPAELAGVRGGDMVIRFGGREIGDLYEYTDALREHAPGDTVEIALLRDGEEIVVQAVLGSR